MKESLLSTSGRINRNFLCANWNQFDNCCYLCCSAATLLYLCCYSAVSLLYLWCISAATFAQTAAAFAAPSNSDLILPTTLDPPHPAQQNRMDRNFNCSNQPPKSLDQPAHQEGWHLDLEKGKRGIYAELADTRSKKGDKMFTGVSLNPDVLFYQPYHFPCR